MYGLVTPDTVVQVAAPEGLDRRLNPAAAPCVLSIAGAVQATVSALPVPRASDTALGMLGAAAAVVSVLVADQALKPVAFELWICTSIAAPAARPERLYGLVTPDTVVQLAAPEGLDRRLNPVAPLWVPSTAGAGQVTTRAPSAPCASNAALGVFGAYDVGGGVDELGCPKARIVAWGRLCVRGGAGYFGIFCCSSCLRRVHVVIRNLLSRC